MKGKRKAKDVTYLKCKKQISTVSKGDLESKYIDLYVALSLMKIEGYKNFTLNISA